MAKLYNINKWRKNSKNSGAIIELSCYDEEKQTWSNVKLSVRFASEYGDGDNPAAKCAVDKNGDLVIKCFRYDNAFDKKGEVEKTVKEAKAKAEASGDVPAKKKETKTETRTTRNGARVEVVEGDFDDEEEPF
ncbi:MAG: hypothetical protein MJ072_00045 [Clostridia bacterium]|nr:hypothetical protein [Clostridia bacterium]